MIKKPVVAIRESTKLLSLPSRNEINFLCTRISLSYLYYVMKYVKWLLYCSTNCCCYEALSCMYRSITGVKRVQVGINHAKCMQIYNACTSLSGPWASNKIYGTSSNGFASNIPIFIDSSSYNPFVFIDLFTSCTDYQGTQCTVINIQHLSPALQHREI